MNFKSTKEFGFILMYFLPYVYSLHKQGKITSTESRLGTNSLFFWSPNHTEIDEHDETMFPQQQLCYSHKEPEFTKQNWEVPDLNSYYKNDEIVFDKPILTIHNKNTKEWQSGPFNYFTDDVLRVLFSQLSEKYQIVYIRPFYENSNMTKDKQQNVVNIGDEQVLKEFPDVIWIKDLYNDSFKSYNELQFKILANSEHHIAPAGDCVIPAYFGGDLIIFSHPQCMSSNRGVWKSNSWLTNFSGCNVYSYNNYNDIINNIKRLWL